MKKITSKLGIIAVTAALSAALTACQTAQNTQSAPLSSQPEVSEPADKLVIEEEIMPEISLPEYGGGDELGPFYSACKGELLFAYYPEFIDYVKEALSAEEYDRFQKLLDDFGDYGQQIIDIDSAPSLPFMVKEFKLDEKKVYDILSKINDYHTQNNHSEHIYGEEAVVAISKGDIKKSFELLPSELAIFKDNVIYTPAYIYSHTMSDFEAAGITAEDISSRAKLYEQIPIKEEAQKAFQNKVLKYAALQAQKGNYSGTFEISSYADFEVPENIGKAKFIKNSN